MATTNITNFTNLPDDKAADHLTKMHRLFFRGEEARHERVAKASDSIDIVQKNLWSEEDKAFFKAFDMTPYQFQMYRPLINSLISRQRNRRFEFNFVPNDTQSHRRFLEGKDQFVEDALQTEKFTAREDAERYYEQFADDHYAEVVTGVLNQVRNESNAKYVESESFENGIIGGLDFLKSEYSTKNNREGSIAISRVPLNSIVYDPWSREYDLSDIEFIGEVELLYKDQLIARYPKRKEEIEKKYELYTNKDFASTDISKRDYETYFDYHHANDYLKVRMPTLWTLETEKRVVVFDQEENLRRVAHYTMTQEDVWKGLVEKVLDEIQEEAKRTGDYSVIEREDIKTYVADIARQRFLVDDIYEEVWYKTTFTYDTIFEFERSPFPHQSHPYTPFFAQFTEGNWSSVVDDIKDIIKAQNKALMFREMMMAHGAKGMIIVNQDVLAQSNYDVDDIAEAYTRIGSVVALKLKPHQRLDQSIFRQTDIGQGLNEINALIQDYDMRLMQIAGVNQAQMGDASADAPASRYKLQLAAGESNNGLIFDNFIRSLELFYKKMIPMVVEMIRDKGQSLVRQLGDQISPWVDVEFNEDFDVFADAIREGKYGFTLIPKNDDPQINASQDAQLMQAAMAGAIPMETAFRFSNRTDKHKILKDIRDQELRDARTQAAMQVDLQQVQQIAAQMGFDPDQTIEFVNKLKVEKYKQMEQGRQKSQTGQGGSEVQRQAMQPIQEQIQTTT